MDLLQFGLRRKAYARKPMMNRMPIIRHCLCDALRGRAGVRDITGMCKPARQLWSNPKALSTLHRPEISLRCDRLHEAGENLDRSFEVLVAANLYLAVHVAIRNSEAGCRNSASRHLD